MHRFMFQILLFSSYFCQVFLNNIIDAFSLFQVFYLTSKLIWFLWHIKFQSKSLLTIKETKTAVSTTASVRSVQNLEISVSPFK